MTNVNYLSNVYRGDGDIVKSNEYWCSGSFIESKSFLFQMSRGLSDE